MDIYSTAGEEGILDLGKARDQLQAARGINNTDERRKIVAEITAGALLDIAVSLRPLAAEVRDAQLQTLTTGGVSYLPSEPDEPEGTPAWMLLDVGDWVDGEGFVAEPGAAGKIAELAIREDEPSARVQWFTEQGKPIAEHWVFLAACFGVPVPVWVEAGLRTEAAEHEADIAGEPESSTMIAEGIPAHVESDDERRQRVDREREERIAAEKANPTPEPEAPAAAPAGDPMFSIGADDDASPAAEMRAARGGAVVDIDSDFAGETDPLTVLKAKTKKAGKGKKGSKK